MVHLYIRDICSTLVHPLKELKGFSKIELSPGQSGSVAFELSAEDLCCCDPVKKAWVCEPGEFEVLIGPPQQISGKPVHSPSKWIVELMDCSCFRVYGINLI